ncbi:MAG: transposase [Pseudobacteriovorax sp.]|nr:transposase [Pseudobacteriovorax sp.]
MVTDNGSSFLARRFRDALKDYGFDHFRIRYRTPSQLGLLERLHGTLKKEEIYWHLYESPEHARQSLEKFRQRYNKVRPHWSLVPKDGGDPLTPFEVYTSEAECKIPKWQGWAKAAKEKIDEQLLMTGS